MLRVDFYLNAQFGKLNQISNLCKLAKTFGLLRKIGRTERRNTDSGVLLNLLRMNVPL